MRAAIVRRCAGIAVLGVVLAGCGQKGPPLPPLHLVPAPVTELTARRVGDQVRLRFVLPTANANGPGPVELDRVEIYAVTAPPGVTPPNRMLLSKEYLVGQVAVRPPLAEGEEPKEGDTRPGAGAAVVFDDALTPEKLEPVTIKELEPPAAAAATPPAAAPPAATPPVATPPVETPPVETPPVATPPAATPPVATPPTTTPPATTPPAATPPGVTPPGATAPPAAAAPVSTDPMRVYVARGVTRSGRPGAPSTRVQVPIVTLPSPPPDVSSRVTETAVVLEWKPPEDASAATAFNVYRADDPLQPVNTSPLTAPSFEFAAMKFGEEYCFHVRSVVISKNAAVEGGLSEQECVTPRDVFPPAAPQKPDAVATEGQINLIWDPNTEKDLAGYLVLRGEAPDGMLQPLTPAPIRDARYSDTAVKPGVRYIYAIVAVDNVTPPNASAQSPRVEETAR